MDYEEIAVRMKSFNEERGEETEDEIWVLEHNSVYTYGVSTDLKNIPAQLPYPVLSSDRGGKITYHGPGQLVVYILMDFHRASIKPREFIRKFQSSIFKTVSPYCKEFILNEDEAGIFFKDQKVASFGLKMTKSGSYHGAAINHDMNLDAWNEIVICGNPDHQAIDLRSIGVSIDRDELIGEVKKNILLEFESQILKAS
jgi:lipoyl(octanoyl) transferase|tara:strand:- start:356 stop:952 length:597 start_codon:yes stop_codon:yes gene_type:complete